jgi:hypothetical protein
LSFLETLWTPVEEGSQVDQIGTSLQRDTASRLDVLAVVNRGKMAVRQDGTGEQPQSLAEHLRLGVRLHSSRLDPLVAFHEEPRAVEIARLDRPTVMGRITRSARGWRG